MRPAAEIDRKQYKFIQWRYFTEKTLENAQVVVQCVSMRCVSQYINQIHLLQWHVKQWSFLFIGIWLKLLWSIYCNRALFFHIVPVLRKIETENMQNEFLTEISLQCVEFFDSCFDSLVTPFSTNNSLKYLSRTSISSFLSAIYGMCYMMLQCILCGESINWNTPLFSWIFFVYKTH